MDRVHAGHQGRDASLHLRVGSCGGPGRLVRDRHDHPVGFIGNEWVAFYRIGVGRRVGSVALVADGLHARTDGFTSLAVLLSAGGAALGFRLADPIIGLVIAVAILAVLRTAVRDVFRRLLDGVDPAMVDIAEQTSSARSGVWAVRSVRMRWVGHGLHADAELDIDPSLNLAQAHRIAHDAEHGAHPCRPEAGQRADSRLSG